MVSTPTAQLPPPAVTTDASWEEAATCWLPKLSTPSGLEVFPYHTIPTVVCTPVLALYAVHSVCTPFLALYVVHSVPPLALFPHTPVAAVHAC